MKFVQIVVALIFIIFVKPALADECNSRVFDTTGKIISIPEIESTLGKLSNAGADPRVRVITVDQMNSYGNLDKYVGKMVKQCSSWQSPGGNIKSNLLVLALTPDGTVGIFFSRRGPFQNAMQGHTADVRHEMSGPLHGSDIMDAIKVGVTSIHGLISQPQIQGAKGPVTIINSKPTDFSGLWSVIKWVLFLGVLAAGLILIVRVQSRKEKRRAAQQKAQTSRASCNDLILGFDGRINQIQVLLNSFKSLISDSEFTPLQSKLETLQSKINVAKGQFAGYAELSSNDPNNSGLSVPEYDAMKETFDQNWRTLNILDQETRSIEISVRKLDDLITKAKPSIFALMVEIERATKAINDEKVLKTDGPKATLKQASDLAERANQELADKRFQAVSNTCDEATKLANRAIQEVQNLATRKQQIEKDIQQLDATDVSTKLSDLDTLILNVTQTHGNSSVSGVNESRTRVIQKIDERRSAIAIAKSSSITQNWDEAERQIALAKSASVSINDSIAAVQNLKRSLDRQASQHGPYYSGQHGSRSVVNNTTIINENDSFGSSLTGALLGVELANSLDREERREERYGYDRSRNDDYNIGGDSGSSSYDDNSDSDSDIGGDSGSDDSSSSDTSSGDD